jgi:hypothetical protein
LRDARARRERLPQPRGSGAVPARSPLAPQLRGDGVTDFWSGQLLLTPQGSTAQMRIQARLPVAELPDGVDASALPFDYLTALRQLAALSGYMQPRAWHTPLLNAMELGTARLAARLRFEAVDDAGRALIRRVWEEGACACAADALLLREVVSSRRPWWRT